MTANQPEALIHSLGLKEELAREIAAIGSRARVNILSDQPATEDAFGFDALVRTLSDVILSDSTQTPITIGIDGEWGTGKTSIMKMIETQARMLDFSCVWLNAWSLETTENLIAAVASEIQNEIDAKDKGLKSSFRQNLARWMTEALISVGGSLAGSTIKSSILEPAEGLVKAGFERERSITELASIVSTRRSFESLVELILRDSKTKRRRLLVFVDDIDRALPDQIANLLKNLKLILEIPQCVFVVAMDMNLVARSIEDHYRKQNTSTPFVNFNQVERSDIRVTASSGSLIGEGFGDKFLEKLVQIRVAVPILTREEVSKYLKSIGIAPEILEIVRWAPSSEILNPRRLKRYINWLSISLQLIMATNMPPEITNNTALQSMALQRDFPEIYQNLVSRSKLNLDAFFLKQRISDEVEQKEFRKYLHDLANSGITKFDRFARSTPLLGVEWGDYRGGELELYSEYKVGLERLLEKIDKSNPNYLDLLSYQARLIENIERTRRYGDTESRKAERAQIIEQLNLLALSEIKLSFNELCW